MTSFAYYNIFQQYSPTQPNDAGVYHLTRPAVEIIQSRVRQRSVELERDRQVTTTEFRNLRSFADAFEDYILLQHGVDEYEVHP